MAIYSILPSTNLRYQDIRDTLNANGGTVGNTSDYANNAWSAAAKINRWAKYKPVNHAKLFSLTDTERASVNYGIGVIDGGIDPLKAIMISEYIYYGVANEMPKRVSDFFGYNPNCISPLSPMGDVSFVRSSSGDLTITINKNSTLTNNLITSDFTPIKNCKLALGVYSSLGILKFIIIGTDLIENLNTYTLTIPNSMIKKLLIASYLICVVACEATSIYTLSYDFDGATLADTGINTLSGSYFPGCVITKLTNMPTKNRYTLQGFTVIRSIDGYYYNGTSWQSSAITIPATSFVMPSSDVTVKAIFTGSGSNYSYSILYPNDATPGSGGTPEGFYANGTTITLPTTPPTFPNATLNGYFVKRLSDGYYYDGTQWQRFSSTMQVGHTFPMPTSDVTVSTLWNRAYQYSIIYNGGVTAGTGGSPQGAYVKGATITSPTNPPTFSGATFQGYFVKRLSDGLYWNLQSWGKFPYAFSSFSFPMPDSNVDVTLLWNNATTYAFTLVMPSGVNAPNTGSPTGFYVEGATITSPTNPPTLIDSTFVGYIVLRKDGAYWTGIEWASNIYGSVQSYSFPMPDQEVTVLTLWNYAVVIPDGTPKSCYPLPFENTYKDSIVNLNLT